MDRKISSTLLRATPNTSITNVNENMTYLLPYDDAWVISSTAIITIFFIFGLIANSIAIAVIRTSPRLRNQYYLCLASLCVSDIVSGLNSILFLYKQIWGFLFFYWPPFFCRLFWGIYFWTSFSTALHILSFAILRLFGIRWPIKYQHFTSKHMKIWLFGIWVFTFAAGFIPHFIFNSVKSIDRENDEIQARWESCSVAPQYFTAWQTYAEIAYDLIFSISAIGIFSISVAIAVILKKQRFGPAFVANVSDISSVSKDVDLHVSIPTASYSQNTNSSNSTTNETFREATKRKISVNRETALQRRRRKDKQIIIQLFLIVCSFLIGYIPLVVYNFYVAFAIMSSNSYVNMLEWKFAMTQYILLRFSECLNPIIYNLSSKKMRNETNTMIEKYWGRLAFYIGNATLCKAKKDAFTQNCCFQA